MIRKTLLTTTLLTSIALPLGPPLAGQPPKAALCPPRAGWASMEQAQFKEEFDPGHWNGRIHNLVHADAGGGYRWNGAPIDAKTLGQYLDLTAMMRPAPVLALNRPAGVDCARLAEAAALVERHLGCRPDLCVLTAGASEEPVPPPAPPAPPPVLLEPLTPPPADIRPRPPRP